MSEINVSVIVPVYNKEKYLEECLNSLINQTLKHIEIICVDDGSTDSSSKILKQYSEQDKRIKYLKQKNAGPGSARNNGLRQAQGEYVAFVDADDWIELESLELLYNNAKDNDSEIVLFNAIEHLPNNNFRKRIYYPYEISKSFNLYDKKDIVMNNYLIVCTKLHKLSFIKENSLYFSEKNLFEDVYFHIKSMVKAREVTYVNQIFYNYRRTEKNTRQSNSIRSSESFIFLDILENVKTLLIEEKVYDFLEENYYKFKLTELKNIFENNNEKETFFNLLNDDFNRNIINQKVLEKLPPDLNDFYYRIIKSSNLNDYYNFSENNRKKEKSLFRLFRKHFF